MSQALRFLGRDVDRIYQVVSSIQGSLQELHWKARTFQITGDFKRDRRNIRRLVNEFMGDAAKAREFAGLALCDFTTDADGFEPADFFNEMRFRLELDEDLQLKQGEMVIEAPNAEILPTTCQVPMEIVCPSERRGEIDSIVTASLYDVFTTKDERRIATYEIDAEAA